MVHYKINQKEKRITADIAHLTDEEQQELMRYQNFGYIIVDGKIKTPVKRLTEEKIISYLSEHHKDGIEQYTACKDEKKKDKHRKSGFNAGRNWFAKTYPLDISELHLTDTQKKEIEKAFESYLKKKQSQKKKNPNEEIEILTAEEYMRYHYWTKIYTE